VSLESEMVESHRTSNARVSKSTNDDLTRSGTGCFIADSRHQRVNTTYRWHASSVPGGWWPGPADRLSTSCHRPVMKAAELMEQKTTCLNTWRLRWPTFHCAASLSSACSPRYRCFTVKDSTLSQQKVLYDDKPD